ncbi:MAG TPA: exodeoxyribonuclease VII small subunit [Deltaproteobacteria bacterium]|nr:exodeoxyribonuclease VII small subunit [Deltaproteobacteria bacterium]
MHEPEAGFEETLAELELRVRQLEAGDISLEEALSLFEQGVELVRRCHDQLDAAEDRVAQLVRGADGVEEQPMDDVE